MRPVLALSWRSIGELALGTLGWSVVVALLVVVEGALWPTVRDSMHLDELVAAYPAALRELFALDSMSTGTGFLDAELFTLVLPTVLSVFAITRGARLTGGDEEAGLLELVLTTPLSPAAALLAWSLTLVGLTAALGVVTCASTLGASALFDLGIGVEEAVAGTTAVLVLAISLGSVALAVGAAGGRRALALGVAGFLAAASYLLHVVGALTEVLDSVAAWSPVELALADGPLASGFHPALLGLPAGAVVVVAVSAVPLTRRDLCTH